MTTQAMVADVFSLHSYLPNPWALPPAVVALLLGREGLGSLLRRPLTEEAIEGGRYLLSGAVWLLATTLMLASGTEAVALVWARASIVGLAAMPVFGWGYSRVLLTRGPPQAALFAVWLLTAWIIAEAFYTDTVIASVEHHAWGYYPRHGWVGTVMLGLNLAVSGLVSIRFYRDLFSARRGSLRRRRNESFLSGLSLGMVAYVDFLPCYGIAVYPFGYVALLGMLLVLSRGIRRYGLLDLTLSRAAEAVLQVTTDGMIAVDADGRIQLTNPAAEALLGLDALRGRTVAALGGVLTLEDHTQQLGQPPQTTGLHRNGRVLELRNTPIMGEGELPAGTLYVLRDVTEAREAVQQLEAAKALAEQAAQQKTRFLTTMSHEIRTPLGGVIGTTELLLDTELSPTQQRYATVARASGRHLLGVVNDILDYSRLEAGGFTPRHDDFAVSQVVHDAVAVVHSQATARGLDLQTVLHPDLPHWVRGDPRAVGQVLVNLLGNAVKFTPRGHVRVEVEPADGGIEFRVCDTGIGIPAEHLPRLFERFSQVDDSTTRRHGGSGLGLAISQRLCEAMGGRIEVHSESGEGSTFAFTLPLPAGEEPAAKPATEPTRSLAGLRVLMAEDNEVNQMVARAMLEAAGIEVEVVGDGAAAVKAAARDAYDLVLMDCEMPGMDGYTATARIRDEAGPGPRVPIVALTAHALPEERQRCLTAGMDDYLTKPVTKEQLAQVVERWTSKS